LYNVVILKSGEEAYLYLIWPSCIYIWSQNVYLDPPWP